MAHGGVARSPHLHDSSLAAALGGRLSPSPWSRFLSPSLFSQRSSTPTQTQAGAPPAGSPLKESTTAAGHQPGQFTHAKEINPFERSFAVLDAPSPIHQSGADAGGRDLVAALSSHVELSAAAAGRPKRKRAFSSPAIFTPGGTGQLDLVEDDSMRAFLQAKRPALRFATNNDSGIGLVEAQPAVDILPSASTYSLRSSVNSSFDSTTGTSFFGHRRAQSLTESPDTSIAPSPPSPKLGAGVAAGSFVADASTDAHFQPQPLGFTMPPAASMPYGDSSMFAMTTLAPASIAPHAVAPLPYATQPQTFEPVAMSLDPMASYAPYAPVAPVYAPPPVGQPLIGSLLPTASLAPVPIPATASAAVVGPPIPLMQTQFPPIPTSTLAPSHLPHAAPLLANSAPHPPAPKPASSKTGKKPSPRVGGAKTLGPAPSSAPSAAAKDASPAAATKPPGKKRGRKPKNWDPTLETTIELDPEEAERQRKLALERNRIAASKSRRRKKERVELLESASTDLCTRNLALQTECRALLTEVHALRTMIAQAHPEQACQCPHIIGYVVRERDGGGIPAIMYGAGGTLDRDYSRTPKWGTEDDVFAGAVESQALEAFATGSSLVNLVGGRRDDPRATSSIRSDTPGSMAYGAASPVVGVGQVPLRAPSGSPGKKGSAQQARRASAAAATHQVHGADEDESDESEPEETVELKSRRARTITARTK